MGLSLAVASARGADAISFTRDIRPILSQHCFKCHGPDKQKSDLRLDQRESAIAAAESGNSAIVPGKPGESELLRRITSDDPDEAMPPKDARLTPPEIEKLRQWIAAGSKYEMHWAYVKPARPTTPENANAIDHFIHAKLEQEGLPAAPPAPLETLCRRVHLDLTGLPPTPEEAAEFVDENYERVVDHLLASPRFGEQWARPWLDLARSGDSAGYQHDMEMPLWLYRDWVIRALNANMRFDRFTIEQLAGDLLPDATPDQRIATGFNRCATATLGADNDPAELRAQLMWDRVSTLGTTWLGTSLECAQCHNHKFDPFTQREYYSLFAYFNRAAPELTRYFGDHYYITGGVLEFSIPPAQRAQLDTVRREIVSEFDAIEALLSDTKSESILPPIRRLLITPREERAPERIAYLFVDELSRGQKIAAPVQPHVDRIKQLARDLDRLRAPRSLVLEEDRSPAATRVLLRGNIRTPGDEVSPGTPAALHPPTAEAPQNRLGLAQWIVSRDNPLTARVMVNRWWAEIFGQGIVATPEDFGVQGEAPTHPELLDWLAVEFMESGWDMKQVLKRIVMSAAYRRSSRATPASLARDPQNKLLARGPRTRLDAETLRDSVLAIAGLLSHEIGGRPVAATRAAVEDGDSFTYRRSIYVRQQRGEPYATFTAFDAPDRFACTARRPRSNTPLQALTLLNEPVFVEAAQSLAARALKEAPANERAAWMFRACLARPPQPSELAELDKLHSKKLAAGGSEAEACFLVANVLLNLDETITKE